MSSLIYKRTLDWFIGTERRILVINDSPKTKIINGLAGKVKEKISVALNLPKKLIRTETASKNSNGADKLYVYYRSEKDKIICKLLTQKLTKKYEYVIEKGIKSINRSIKKSFKEHKNVGIIIRVSGEL